MKRYVRAVNILKDKDKTISILQSIANKPLWIHAYVKNYNGDKKDENWIRIHYIDMLGDNFGRVSFWEFVGSTAFAEGYKCIVDTYARPYSRSTHMIQIIEPVTIISQEEMRQKYIDDIGFHSSNDSDEE